MLMPVIGILSISISTDPTTKTIIMKHIPNNNNKPRIQIKTTSIVLAQWYCDAKQLHFLQ